jgi:hypothetical protein
MPHQYWIDNCKPKYCGDCVNDSGGCSLDERLVCSPDCEQLKENGDPMGHEECADCESYEIWCEISGLDLKRHP